MIRLRVLILLLLLAMVPWSQAAVAEELEIPSVTLDQRLKVTFTPQSGFFVVMFDGGGAARRLSAVLLPPGKADQDLGSPGGVWYAGARVAPPPGARALAYSLLLVSPEGRVAVSPIQTRRFDPLSAAGTDVLRGELLQRKEVLSSWKLQEQAQEESLRRLRSDAELIGNFGRILDLKEGIERARLDQRNVERDLETLRHFLTLVKSRPPPHNHQGREAQLTRQIAELAQAAKVVESQELRQRSQAEGALQRKLAVIESTRHDDYDALRGELRRLVRNRQRLEASQPKS